MNRLTAAAALLALASTTQAQFGSRNPYYSGSGNPYYSGSGTATATGSSSTSTSASSSDGFSFGGYTGYNSSFNYSQATTIRLAHGVLGALAWVIFFPAGAISIRLIPGRLAFWMHVIFQILGYLIFIASFGLGVYLAREFTFGSFSLIHTYHPIIGIVLFVFLFFQPILGYIHHRAFKRYKRRTFWSYAHLWLGRILITVGIINGGLGLRLANNTRSGEIAYGVVAGVIWLVWVAAAVYGEVKRWKGGKAAAGRKAEVEEAQEPPSYSERPALGHRSTSNMMRAASQRGVRDDGPSQTPLMQEGTGYGGAGAEEGHRASPVREFYGRRGQGERTWV